MKSLLLSFLLLLSGQVFAAPPPAPCTNLEDLSTLVERIGGELVTGAGLFAVGVRFSDPRAHVQAVQSLMNAFNSNQLSRSMALKTLGKGLIPLLAWTALEATAILLSADGLVYWLSQGRQSLLGTIAGHHPKQTCRNIKELHEALTARPVVSEQGALQ